MFIAVLVAIFTSFFIESALLLLQQKRILTKLFGKQAFILHVLATSTVWLITAIIFILFQFEKHPVFHNIAVLKQLGLVLIPMGLIIGGWAFGLLGWKRMFSVRLFARKQPKIVKRSLYRYLKHPLYYGMILALAGFTLYKASLYNLIILLEVIGLLIPHIRIEEKGFKKE